MKFNDLSITFHTDKIRECVDFYCHYFDAKLTFDAEWYVMVRLVSDDSMPIYLSFQGSTDEMKRDIFAGGISLNLKVDDVDSCYKKLQPTGISFVEKITDHEWGDRAFSVQDPIGNLLYIYSERKLGDKYKDAVKE
ncbi:MAG: VOC family protein [Tannerella sp.]|jgi:uncharacterized glyoxalase superfamily protein PhnB|nr:VOC family protein [Tannerella sp.]